MKRKRQETIKWIISTSAITTQEDLAKRLTEDGYKVTQATVSRDIREMGLRKAHSADGRLIYVLPEDRGDLSEGGYGRVLREGFTSIEAAESLLVVKTASGMAMAAAAAIDKLNLGGITGTIAGDDTIFLAVRTGKDAEKIIGKVESIIENVR